MVDFVSLPRGDGTPSAQETSGNFEKGQEEEGDAVFRREIGKVQTLPPATAAGRPARKCGLGKEMKK
jgi:uncharacterized protein (DUF2249 family)